ncbi:DUF2189 domain-containing protein [uncultured Thiodictyon sp.]|uniref:DUF2189 domain-containing protein n=1 Tax=uncultured Thiodictyon sp. TaxID=1846217 RepID=UPI0025E9B128|nr:DUF2189 domain-containing protein [uncultured Thiodictyon sp.]
MDPQITRPTSSVQLARDQVRGVALTAPYAWLKAGVDDFRSAVGHSLLYGVLFAAACWATALLTASQPWLTLGFVSGLLLIGPYMASGLYVAARQLDAGEAVSIRAALRTLAAHKTHLALFAVLLTIIMDAWVRVASILFALQFEFFSPSIDGYLGLLSAEGDPWALAYFVGIGFLLAAVVFVTCAVAIPLIVDRDRNPIAAIGLSARAVWRNWPAMLVWAAIIVVLSTIGILTLFGAFIVFFPVLGYATWHSYRAMVE